MKQIIDVSNWPRESCYQFFRYFGNPFMCVTCLADCTHLQQLHEQEQLPVSSRLMYAALRSANEIEEFRYRQEGEAVVLYDTIRMNTPILKEDHNFTTVILPYLEDWKSFEEHARSVIEKAKQGQGEAFPEHTRVRDTMVVSIMPFLHFTGIQHGFGSTPAEGLPVITLGKMTEGSDGKWTLPVAVAVHHGFVDGFHIGRFMERFEQLINQKP